MSFTLFIAGEPDVIQITKDMGVEGRNLEKVLRMPSKRALPL